MAYRDALPSSFAFLDTGWKYTYDKYNDVYRYVPLNGDVAGCCVRTDRVAERGSLLLERPVVQSRTL